MQEVIKGSTNRFASGGGEMGRRIREFDWSFTSLGPLETWPESLRTCVRIMLTSQQPIWIGWGKDLVKLYNDPYLAIIGGKHPRALGEKASVVWQDIWSDISPMLNKVMHENEGTYVESQLLIMERNGYPEETYYTFSYTPIANDLGAVEGMICFNTDDTERIISERQLLTLTELGKNLTEAKTEAEAINQSINTVSLNPYDFPYALFYSIKDSSLVLSQSTELGDAAEIVLKELDLQQESEISGQCRKAIETHSMQVLTLASSDIEKMPKGAWKTASEKLIILPIVQSATKQAYGLLMVALNPHRLLDEKYKSFFSLLSDQIAASFHNVNVLEQERKRAEALAEIDRAKTIFFSNISHEFRTPLTLLLGPIEEVLEHPMARPETKVRIEVAYRNALRMQKLVNTLLDFSRIEAGRMVGKFSRVDIAAFTSDLASTFRSAIEKAGMQLEVESGVIKDDVYVDKDMWEKIILNLLSNAFKYSKQGTIRVRIAQFDDNIEVAVSDNGIGIPKDHLNKIFERFHRVENTEGRSGEGTGIGLAMVKELVKLHHGSITVTSEPGKGSTFTIVIPTGIAHLPSDKIDHTSDHNPTSSNSIFFTQEAMKWFPEDAQKSSDKVESEVSKDKILVADDNADMRNYVKRLLGDDFEVITAVNGEDAFEKAKQLKPDLLLSDIMMPKVDGLALLKLIREDAEIKNVPVIFLSARAGEEAKVEGLNAGADDYIVKPFSARELVSTVKTNIQISKSRTTTERNLRNVIAQAPVAMCILRGPQLVVEIANEKMYELWGKKADDVLNKPIFSGLPEAKGQGFEELLNKVFTTGETVTAVDVPVTLPRNNSMSVVYINFAYAPINEANNSVSGVIVVATEVTEQVLSRKKIEEAEERSRLSVDAGELGTFEINFLSNEMITSKRFSEIFDDTSALHSSYINAIHPDDRGIRDRAYEKAVRTGSLDYTARIIHKNKSIHWVRIRGKVYFDESKKPMKLLGVVQDITDQKEVEREKDDFIGIASHELKTPLTSLKGYLQLMGLSLNDLPEKVYPFFNRASEAVKKLEVLVSDLLDISKIQSGKLEFSTNTVSVTELINYCVENVKHLYPSFVIEEIIEPNLTVQANFDRLEQVLMNIISNAVKYSRDQKKFIIKAFSADHHTVSISVTDFGMGISPADKEKIFDRFYRTGTNRQTISGLGLGLYISSEIIKAHGGKISVESQIDKGSTFSIMLPTGQMEVFRND